MADDSVEIPATGDEIGTAAANVVREATSTVKVRTLAGGQVDRVVGSAVPEGMHLARNARLALQKAATISVLYLACLADDARRQGSKRRVTMSAQDVRDAVLAAGMTHLLPSMRTAAKRGREEE